MSTNPFTTADAWEVSTDILLPIGSHLVTIVEVEDGTSKSSNKPSLDLRVENDQGSLRDWVPYNEDFLGKVVALFKATGVQLPQEGEFDPNDHCRLGTACINRLQGKKVGVVVHDEDDNRNPDQKRRRVKGYVEPSKVTGGPDARGLPEPAAVGSADDSIPF